MTEFSMDCDRSSQNPETISRPNTSRDPKDYFSKQVNLSESASRLNLLITSLKHVKEKIFSYENKENLISLLKNLQNFDETKTTCQKLLLSMNEFRLSDIQDISTVESSDIRHLSPSFILEFTKSVLASGKPVGPFFDFSLEILKHGISVSDLKNIEKIAKNPDFHSFAWHYVHCFFKENFETFIQSISSCIEKGDNQSKKVKNGGFLKPELKVTNPEKIRTLDLGDFILAAVNSKDLAFLSFLRGLTCLEMFKSGEDTQAMKDFFAFAGLQPATTLDQIIDCFIRSKSILSLPKSLSSVTPVTLYKTLNLLPVHILQNTSEVPQSYIKTVLEQLITGKIFFNLEDFKSLKFLINYIIRALFRTFSIISNESQIKSCRKVEVFIGFENLCHFCGNQCEAFCDYCMIRKIPVVFPVFGTESPDFLVLRTETVEVKTKIAKNTILKDFQEALEKCSEIVKTRQKNHDCLTDSKDFSFIISCLFLKHFSKKLDFSLDSCSASLILPVSLMSPKNKTFLKSNLFTSKSLALKLLETSKTHPLIFKKFNLLTKVILWPSENPELLFLTRRSLELLKFSQKISIQDLLSFTKPKFLSEWAEAVSKTIGFLDFLRDLQDFNLEPFLPKIEVELILKHNSEKVFQILKRLFKEYKNSEVNLFYTSVIVGIAWQNREEKLKDLEQLCGKVLGKSIDENVNISELYHSAIPEHLNQAKIFLLCELGLGRVLNEWIYVNKTGNGQVVLPTANVEQFFRAFSIISEVFNASEFLSQSIKYSACFDWAEFFQLASAVDVIVLPDKTHLVNFLLGICKLCFHYNEIGENLQYLSAKIIGICGHLLEIDRNFMLQVLEELVNCCNIKLHYLAVLSLAFVGRDHEKGQKIMEKVFFMVSEDELAKMDDLFFMVLEQELNCLQLLRTGYEKKWGKSNFHSFLSLQRALSINFPLVQYAALTLVPEIVRRKVEIPYEKLILALNKANSMLSARHHTGELPYSLGTMIDNCIGIVGAHYCLEPIEINYNHHLTAWITCENFYSNVERLYLSQKMMEGSSNDSVVEILKSLYFYPKREPQEYPWTQCKSLREWTQNLIHFYHQESLYSSIPLAQVNLDTLIYILPEIFRKNVSSHDYFASYLSDFFENSPSTYRRLMLKVIDKCPVLKSKLPIQQLLRQYIDLNEFPRALHLLEAKIRDRVNSLNRRYNPSLISSDEMVLCKQVFSGLHSWKYLNSIPEVCKSLLDEEKLFKSKFKSGFFSHFLISKVDTSLTVAASWRIGLIQDVVLSNNIDSCLAFILKSEDKEQASREVRNFLIKNSDVRIADFCQAYEHILLQHLIENILGMTQGRYSFQDIQKRNKVIQDKFVYKEAALRVSFILSKQLKNTRNFVASLYDLFQLAFLYRDYTYCHNLLNDLCIYDNFTLKFPLISRYLTSKHLLLTGQIDRKGLKSLENLWNFLPINSESPEKLGFFSNLKFKYKVAVLIIRVLVFLTPQVNINETQEKYLKVLDENYEEIRLSLEKGFAVLAGHLFQSAHSAKGEFQESIGEKVALLYLKSLRHGHNQHCNSSSRVLLLFMKLSEKLIRSRELMDGMIELAHKLPLFIWADRVNELVSYANTSSEDAKVVLSIIFARLLKAHHSQMVWIVGPYVVNVDKNGENRSRFLKSVYQKHCKSTNSSLNLQQLQDLFNPLIQLAIDKNCVKVPNVGISFDLAFPCKENFSIIEYSKSLNLWGKDLPGFIMEPVLVTQFEASCDRLNSKSNPAKVHVRCSDGKIRIVLCKYEAKSDIRKETRVNQIIDHLNIVFAKDPECRRLNIRLPTYSIVYLGKKCVVIEWVNDTSTIKSILRTINPKSANLGGHTDPKVWAGIQDRIRPCFHQYFFQKYPEPNDWLIARNNYIRSLAAWSIFGYVIGLGDRHLENIMINNQSGSVMLIDFECIFDLGLTFTFPELVPFRLTPEIQTAMGLFFEEGEFIKTAVKVLACMKKNITSIMIQLECFVNDPLNIYISNPEYHSKNCDLLVTLKIIRARLEGYEKYAGTRVFLTDKEQVRFLVDKAKDPELLRKMFQGWAPWE